MRRESVPAERYDHARRGETLFEHLPRDIRMPEGHHVAPGLRCRGQLAPQPLEPHGQVVHQTAYMGGDPLDAGLLEQLQRRREARDERVRQAALFEAPGVGQQLVVDAVEVEVVGRAPPADQRRVNVPHHRPVHEDGPDPHHAEHPLVTVGRKEVDPRGLPRPTATPPPSGCRPRTAARPCSRQRRPSPSRSVTAPVAY